MIGKISRSLLWSHICAICVFLLSCSQLICDAWIPSKVIVGFHSPRHVVAPATTRSTTTSSTILTIPTRRCTRGVDTALAASVESVTMERLQNHEQVGAELAGSVQRWLDFEWMPQDVHVRMGEVCRRSYIACREAGVDDLMTIMTSVVDDLEAEWKDFDDSFVNAWDVANYISDFLTEKAGLERCECSARIH